MQGTAAIHPPPDYITVFELYERYQYNSISLSGRNAMEDARA
jgi:hypothetical protein